MEGEGRKAQWVSLKHKATGLAQPRANAQNCSKEQSPAQLPVKTRDDLDCSGDLEASEPGKLTEPTAGLGDSNLDFTETAMSSLPLSATTQFEEGEASGVSHHSDEEDDGGSFSGLVGVDLAGPMCEGGMLLTTGSPISSPIIDVDPWGECPVMEEAVNTVPMVVVDEHELSSPLVCSPLAVLEPNISPIRIVEDSGKDTEELSYWVKRQYRGSCRQVGFPIDTHEQQCLALLQRIEAERFQHGGFNKLKRSVGSSRKGARELRHLASSINYDGRPSGC